MVKKIGVRHCIVAVDTEDLIIPYKEIAYISELSQMSTPIMGLVPNKHFGESYAPKAEQHVSGTVDKDFTSNYFNIHMKSGTRIRVDLINFNGMYLQIPHLKVAATAKAKMMSAQVFQLHSKIFKSITK